MRDHNEWFCLGFVLGGLIVFLCTVFFPALTGRNGHRYPGTLIVREVTEQYALTETATGFAWLIEPEDWEEGDLVSVIFDDNGTPDDIRDDEIVEARFSGYRAW